MTTKEKDLRAALLKFFEVNEADNVPLKRKKMVFAYLAYESCKEKYAALNSNSDISAYEMEGDFDEK